jgi:hypothetical protein
MECVCARVQNIYDGEITLHVAEIVNTEELQHYTYIRVIISMMMMMMMMMITLHIW